jgi:hypothetical protein
LEIIANLKQDDMVGEHVKRDHIPKYYLKKHNMPFFRVALPKRWCLTYSIAEFEVKGELGGSMKMQVLNVILKYLKSFGKGFG